MSVIYANLGAAAAAVILLLLRRVLKKRVPPGCGAVVFGARSCAHSGGSDNAHKRFSGKSRFISLCKRGT